MLLPGLLSNVSCMRTMADHRMIAAFVVVICAFLVGISYPLDGVCKSVQYYPSVRRADGKGGGRVRY